MSYTEKVFLGWLFASKQKIREKNCFVKQHGHGHGVVWHLCMPETHNRSLLEFARQPFLLQHIYNNIQDLIKQVQENTVQFIVIIVNQ